MGQILFLISSQRPFCTIGNSQLSWKIITQTEPLFRAASIFRGVLNYRPLNADFTVDLASRRVDSHQLDSVDLKVALVNTGDTTMNGGRVKRMKFFIANEICMLSCGDDVADIDLDALLSFHRSHGKLVSVSAVRPAALFGELEMDGARVQSFQEKPQMHDGWIDGGYFIIKSVFFDLIAGDSTLLERELLEQATQAG